MDAVHPQVESEGENSVSTAAQSLWNRATNSNKLSSQERETLADTGPRLTVVRCLVLGG